jgi:hypothetical protein
MAAARPAITRATLRLGRIGGIPLGLHYSWFILASLITCRSPGTSG